MNLNGYELLAEEIVAQDMKLELSSEPFRLATIQYLVFPVRDTDIGTLTHAVLVAIVEATILEEPIDVPGLPDASV